MLPIKTREIVHDIHDRIEQLEVLRVPNEDINKYQMQAKKLLRMMAQGKKVGANTSDIDIIAKPGVRYIPGENGILIKDENTNLSVSAIEIEDGSIIGTYEKRKAMAAIWAEGQFLLVRGAFNILSMGVADADGKEIDSADIGVIVEQCTSVDITEDEAKVRKITRDKNKNEHIGVIIKKPRIPLLLKGHLQMSSFTEIGLIGNQVEYFNESMQEVDNVANQYSQKQINQINKYADNLVNGNILIRHVFEELNYESVRVFERLIEAREQSMR